MEGFSPAAARSALGGRTIAFVAALVLLVAALLGVQAATALSSNAATATCTTTLTVNGQPYCPGVISGVTSTSYGTESRIVLQGVSVTARTTRTVTVAAWEATSCRPGYFCGASAGMTLQTLTVAWKGRTRPGVKSVIDLYGTTTRGSMSPAGYQGSGACYIDYC